MVHLRLALARAAGRRAPFRRFWRQPIEQRGDAERLAALRELVAPVRAAAPEARRREGAPAEDGARGPVELGREQRELYEAIRVAAHADVRKAIRAKGVAASSVTILDALTKLRQVAAIRGSSR